MKFRNAAIAVNICLLSGLLYNSALAALDPVQEGLKSELASELAIGEPHKWLVAARGLWFSSNYAEIAKDYGFAAAKCKQETSKNFLHGMQNIFLHKPSEAEECLKRWKTDCPWARNRYIEVGRAYIKMGYWNLACAWLRESLKYQTTTSSNMVANNLLDTYNVYESVPDELCDPTAVDYFDALKTVSAEGTWKTGHSPIKVYFDSNVGSELKASSLRAFGLWSKALDGHLTFTIVTNKSKANIVIYQSDDEFFKAGECVAELDDGHLCSPVKIYFKSRTKWKFDCIALHEVGHALGICNHSPNELDSMNPTDDRVISKLSSRDIGTIRKMYGLKTR